MSELSREARALFKEARAGFDPSPLQKKRVYGAILGSTAPAIATAAASSKLGVSAIATASWIKVVGIALVIGGAGASIALLARAPRAPAPAVERSPSAMTAPPSNGPDLDVRPDERASAADEAVAPRPAAVVPATPPRPRLPPEVASDTLEDEVRAMHDARQALQEGKADLALTLASSYASRYPRGVLHEEELAIRVLALCHLGRTAEATALADRLEKSAPRSPQLARIRMSCVSKIAPKL